ncbi:translation elongation factor Ts (EF-Ts) [Panacagrimonas perspica]|uniref:Elongation factor Ts n=1 Tax=Panacagrimonas perspica TaxID=381431 RepID=A0A4S3K3G1_9GAMM|nr:translation elongation factor Ts [Panacagrimonas perspica]TDU31210.1 translation elongation factor Ts (EF-Ts) [Panacagrimonas perspica]THD02567.1 translation elongation factor Ts [Panacagrimonas perspica]
MAAVTAALIKELRDRTGAGMGDCKKALEAVEGDLDKAIEKLRMDGTTKADKKAGRTAAEGIIALASNAEAVALVEVNSETDFVAKNPEFRALAQSAANAALVHRPKSAEELVALKVGDRTLDELRRELVGKIGENLTIRRVDIVVSGGGPLVTYVHPGDKIAVAVALTAGSVDLAKDLAMHIAAMSPRAVDPASISADIVAAERRIIEAQVAQEQAEDAAAGKKPKPAEIVAKMTEGKVTKFLDEQTLIGQPFVKNDAYGLKSDAKVREVLTKEKATVSQFVRLAVGEGIEKKQTDFAAEVAAAGG